MQDESIIQPNKVSHVIKLKGGANLARQIVNTTDNLNTVPTFNAGQLSSMDIETQQQLAVSTIAQLDQFGGKQIIYISKDATNVDPAIVKFFTDAGFVKEVSAANKNERVRITSPANIASGITKAIFNPDYELAELRSTWVNELKDKSFIDLFTKNEFDRRFQFICGPALAQRAVEIFKMSQQSKFLPSLVSSYERQGEEGFVIRCLNTIPMGLIDKESGQLIAFCRLDDFENGIGHLGDTFVNEKVFVSRMLGTAYLYWCAVTSAELQLQKKFQWVSLIDPPNRVDEFDNVYACRKPNQPDDNLIMLVRFQGPTLCEESQKAKLIEQFYTDKSKYPDPKPTRFEQVLLEQIRLLRELKPTAAVTVPK